MAFLNRWLIAPVVALIAVLRAAGAAPDAPAPALLDTMDGGRPAFRLLAAELGVQLVRQEVGVGNGQFSQSEHLTLTIPAGNSAPLAYPLPAATVIDELRLEAVAWCNWPGMQLAATVVLPRSIDEKTGQRRTLLVRSGQPVGGGEWVELKLDGLRLALERQARVARTQLGPAIDTREAYVTELVILAPSGKGTTELWVDKISLYGPLRSDREADAAQPPSAVELAAVWSAEAPASGAAPPRGDPPALPRIIQWQGEPLEVLQRIGFDAVGMGRLPNERELAEANRLGMWLVCPPPSIEALQAGGLGDDYAPVLAWDLGELAADADVAMADAWARAVELRERVAVRPKVLRPLAMPREASRIAEVMALGRPTLGSTASWLEYAAWLNQQRRLARPGAALWATVDTHASNHARSQLAALRGGAPGAPTASYRHLAQATVATFGAWPRGFYFQSEASLAATDPQTRMRALALELTNLRLGMVEPWLAGGKAVTAAKSSRHDLTAMVLTVERSHLVVPMRWDGAASGAPAAGPVSLVLPGVPESCDAYVLSVAGPRRVETRRITGGLSVTVDELPDDAFLLLTEDGYAFSHVERYLRQYAARAAQARVELAALGRQQAEQSARVLPQAALEAVGAERDLARVDAALTAIHQTLRGQDYATAFARAAEADGVLDELQERVFAAIWPDRQPGSSPLTADWATLADVARVGIATTGSNARFALWPAGDFENLEALLASGWQRSERSPAGIDGAVRLTPNGPHDGVHCLELEARLSRAAGAPPAVAAPPVWVTSPPVEIPAGHVVEIAGWVRVAEQPIGSADPLLVFDSIGGEESAVRVASAAMWTPFRFVRAAPAGAACRVTIALGGVGRATVDSLQYRFIPLPGTALPVASR